MSLCYFILFHSRVRVNLREHSGRVTFKRRRHTRPCSCARARRSVFRRFPLTLASLANSRCFLFHWSVASGHCRLTLSRTFYDYFFHKQYIFQNFRCRDLYDLLQSQFEIYLKNVRRDKKDHIWKIIDA